MRTSPRHVAVIVCAAAATASRVSARPSFGTTPRRRGGPISRSRSSACAAARSTRPSPPTPDEAFYLLTRALTAGEWPVRTWSRGPVGSEEGWAELGACPVIRLVNAKAGPRPPIRQPGERRVAPSGGWAFLDRDLDADIALLHGSVRRRARDRPMIRLPRRDTFVSPSRGNSQGPRPAGRWHITGTEGVAEVVGCSRPPLRGGSLRARRRCA